MKHFLFSWLLTRLNTNPFPPQMPPDRLSCSNTSVSQFDMAGLRGFDMIHVRDGLRFQLLYSWCWLQPKRKSFISYLQSHFCFLTYHYNSNISAQHHFGNTHDDKWYLLHTGNKLENFSKGSTYCSLFWLAAKLDVVFSFSKNLF